MFKAAVFKVCKHDIT